jgi:transcriptional regulator with XRE-family HTH domain
MAERRRSARNKTAKEIAAKVGCSERTVRYWWSIPRAEYEANSIARAAPWEELGMSRATWYRKGKPLSVAPSEQPKPQE